MMAVSISISCPAATMGGDEGRGGRRNTGANLCPPPIAAARNHHHLSDESRGSLPEDDVIQRRSSRTAISIGPSVDFHDWPPLHTTSISHEIATEQTISPRAASSDDMRTGPHASCRQTACHCMLHPPLLSLDLPSRELACRPYSLTSPRSRHGLLAARLSR